jgi:trigger factor
MEPIESDRLKSAVRDASPTRKDIEVELVAAEAAKEYEEVLTAYAGRAKLKGFREGHAPRDRIRQIYGRELEHEVIDRLVPKVLEEVLDSYRIRPASVPHVREASFEEGGPLKFKAAVDVWPDFELPPYRDLKLHKHEAGVSDEDIERAVDDLRRKNAEYVPASGRAAAKGDYVMIELQGRDAKTKRLLPSERVVVLVGREGNDPAVDAHLLGMNVQEEKSFTTSYAPDQANRKLAGKTVDYRLKVLSIKEIKVPEADDDFAKRLGPFDSLAALKEKIREDLGSVRAKAARRETSEEAVQAVIDRAAIELPAGALEEETDAVIRSYAAQVGTRGLSREAAETLQVQARAQAERNLKQHLVIRKIAQAEGLSVSEEDLDREIEEIAKANDVPPARAIESFREDEKRDSLRASLLARKVVDFLVSRAIIESASIVS